jgi:hypothetical protein
VDVEVLDLDLAAAVAKSAGEDFDQAACPFRTMRAAGPGAGVLTALVGWKTGCL